MFTGKQHGEVETDIGWRRILALCLRRGGGAPIGGVLGFCLAMPSLAHDPDFSEA